MTASKWVKSLSLDKKARAAILHTRFWTQGRPEVNDNNHPIQSGSIIGVHNGGVWNDDAIFLKMPKAPRRAQVDSEAIFAALAYGAEAFDASHDTDILEEVYGTAAIAYFDQNTDGNELHLARMASSPLVVAQTEAGSLVFASEWSAVSEAMKAVGLTPVYADEMDEGTYYRIQEGILVESRQFEFDQWASARTTVSSSATGGTRAGAWTTWDDDYDYIEPTGTRTEVVAVEEFGSAELRQYLREEENRQDSKPVKTGAPSAWSDNDFEDFLIEGRNLYVSNIVGAVNGSAWATRYSDRAVAIYGWLDRMAVSELGVSDVVRAATNLDLFTKPGDWVKTNVLGEEFPAQVVDVPNQFPRGDYLVKVLLPKSVTAAVGTEVALLLRAGHQLTPCSTAPTWVTKYVSDGKADARRAKVLASAQPLPMKATTSPAEERVLVST